MTLILLPAKVLLQRLGTRVKAARLNQALSRGKVAQMAGVSESTIKHFEETGEAGSKNMARIFVALGISADLERLAEAQEPKTVEDIVRPARKRGRRADAGLPRRARQAQPDADPHG